MSSAPQIARTSLKLWHIIEVWKADGHKIAFVPTMGALHDGHMSLIEIAKQHATRVVSSIFVNPTQFAPHEDFTAYPRNEKGDLEKLTAAGVDLVYIPTQKDIYPVMPVSDVKAGSAAEGLESDIRPHFFDGVVSVVSRLFKQVQPDIAVFGEKDYQQLCVIRQLVRELRLNVEIVAAPIARDKHGLALSSRNAYLKPDQIETAHHLNRILFELADELHGQPDHVRGILADGAERLLKAGFDDVQYLELRDAETLAPLEQALHPARLLAAVKLGKLRLIDNVGV